MAPTNASVGLYVPDHDKNDPTAVKVWGVMKLSHRKSNAVWCDPCSTWFKKKDDKGLMKHCNKAHYTAPDGKVLSRRATLNNTPSQATTPQSATPKPRKRLSSAVLPNTNGPNVAKKLRMDTEPDTKMQAKTPAATPTSAPTNANVRVATPKPTRSPLTAPKPSSAPTAPVQQPTRPTTAPRKPSAIAPPIPRKAVPSPIAPPSRHAPVPKPVAMKPSAIAPPIARKGPPSAIAPPKKKPTPAATPAPAGQQQRTNPVLPPPAGQQRSTAPAQATVVRKAAPPPFAPPRKSTPVPPANPVPPTSGNINMSTTPHAQIKTAQPHPSHLSSATPTAAAVNKTTALTAMENSNQNPPTPIPNPTPKRSPLTNRPKPPPATAPPTPTSPAKPQMTKCIAPAAAKPAAGQQQSPTKPAIEEEKPPVTPEELAVLNAKPLVKKRGWSYVKVPDDVRKIAERAQANLYASTRVYFYKASFVIPSTYEAGSTVMRGAIPDQMPISRMNPEDNAAKEKMHLLAWANTTMFQAEMAQIGYKAVNIAMRRDEPNRKNKDYVPMAAEEWVVVRCLIKRKGKKRAKKDGHGQNTESPKKAKVENHVNNADEAKKQPQLGGKENNKQTPMDATGTAQPSTATPTPKAQAAQAPQGEASPSSNSSKKKGPLSDFIDLTI